MKTYNPHWFQIDPQLVNEIWAVTAPGMVDYAATKSDWAARITKDGWGIEPTIHYGAMYAAAFFEPDINKLIDIGLGALKGIRWILLKNPENLDDKKDEKERLEKALSLHKPLATAYYLKEDLRQLWSQPSKADAEKFLEQWINKA